MTDKITGKKRTYHAATEQQMEPHTNQDMEKSKHQKKEEQTKHHSENGRLTVKENLTRKQKKAEERKELFFALVV